jgi:hypothetical protein
MTALAQEILSQFDSLPNSEQVEIALEILRRFVNFDVISHSNRKGLMRKPPEPPDYPGNRGGGEHPDEAMSSKR